jgi:hypothetical protein
MAGSNFDPNPAKFLQIYANDPKFVLALRELEAMDTSIGDDNSPAANSVMVRYLNVLLTQREEEIQDRILLIQERDKELQERDKELQGLIDEIHRIYASRRYKLGHLIIHPIEYVVKSLHITK